MPMPQEDDNASDNFGIYEDEKSTPEVQDIEKDHRDLVSKSSGTGSCASARCTPQDRLLENITYKARKAYLLFHGSSWSQSDASVT